MRVDLRGVDLVRVDLVRVDLMGVDLVRVDLMGVDLVRVNLEGSYRYSSLLSPTSTYLAMYRNHLQYLV